ncbi:MAG: UPF0182 family membrane protein [Chloroflexota bacterium]
MSQNRVLWIVGSLFLAYVALGRLGGIYVDWLWFDSVGFQSVFLTRLGTQLALFLVTGLAFFGIFATNVVLAGRLASRYAPTPIIIPWSGSSRSGALLQVALLTAGGVLAVLVGLAMAANWQTVLAFLNPSLFGVSDPLFGMDVSFFVFTLPLYGLVQGWYMAVLFFSLLAALLVYVVRIIMPRVTPDGGMVQNTLPSLGLLLTFGRGPRTHLSVLIALLALGIAFSTWLAIYELVFDRGGLVFGAGYTAVHARWPALWLSLGLAVFFALVVVATTRRRGYRPAAFALGLWVALSLFAGEVYPAAVQRLEVLPSELDKERPYIENNIRMTNQAYDLDRITETDFPAEEGVTQAELAASPGTMKNLRLWDPQPLLDTYNQIQSIRLYYDFLDVDVDRYMIDGEYRQVMLSTRELSPARLPSQAQTWVTRRLQFTHGYGAAVSPVNEVTPEGLPSLFLQDVPPRGKIPLDRPEVYYGEGASEYVVVKTTTPEFDYPRGDDNVYTEYQGSSGVAVGSPISRLLFAWQFGDPNLVLASAFKPESRILYNRNIAERAQKVAPFLTYDRDPYTVVANGRLYWVHDAYTSTANYPYSQPVGLRGGLNYLRNSVKVVTDAYEGQLNFYVADPSDPMIRTYMAIFPSLFQPLDAMPAEIRPHLRYPEDLFSVQADLYRTYHMRDARVFYNREDMWNVPMEIYLDEQVPIQPYYVIMRLPGEAREEFTLILPYTPPNKSNMITWLAARSDGEHYGKLVAYRYPKDKLIFGPMQIEARIDQDPTISAQLSLWNQSGSRVIRGNLLVIPVGKSNLYVEPIYLQAQQAKLPEMKRVVLATGNRVVMEPNVQTAIERLYGGQPAPTPPAAQPAQPGQAQPPGQLSPEAQALLDRLNRLDEELRAVQDELRRILEQ